MSAAGRRLILFGIACLVSSAFFENVRGPILPALAAAHGLDYSGLAGFVSAGSLAAFLLAAAAVRFLARVPLRGFLLGALASQGAGALLAGLGSGAPALLGAGMLWGGGNTGISMTGNLLAIRGSTPESRPRVLSLLHISYGLGSIVPPLYVAWTTAAGWGLLRILQGTLLWLAAVAVLALFLPRTEEPAEQPRVAPYALLAEPRLRAGILAITAYVVGEVLVSTWLVTLLTGRGEMDLPGASRSLQAFFLCLAAGRLAGAFWLSDASERNLPPLCLGVSAVLVALGLMGFRPGFWLCAAAMAPCYPAMLSSLVRGRTGDSPSLVAGINASLTVGLALGHLAVGKLADAYSLRAALVLSPLCLSAGAGLWLARNRCPEGVRPS